MNELHYQQNMLNIFAMLIAFLSHPLVFIPGGMCLAWMTAIYLIYPCLFLLGLMMGPYQPQKLMTRHIPIYLETSIHLLIYSLVGWCKPILFVNLWLSFSFFFLMGLYMSWNLFLEKEGYITEDI